MEPVKGHGEKKRCFVKDKLEITGKRRSKI